jgi:hypothetical protein
VVVVLKFELFVCGFGEQLIASNSESNCQFGVDGGIAKLLVQVLFIGIFYLNGPKININYRNSLRVNLFSQTV